MRILLLGGNVFLGSRIAQTALTSGHDVICSARGTSGKFPAGAVVHYADRNAPNAFADLAHQKWDAVVDVTDDPRHAQAAATAFTATCQKYVFISTVSVYDLPQDNGITEASPVVSASPPDATGQPQNYGNDKVACENTIRETFGIDRSLIVRAGLIGGYGDHTCRSGYWPHRFANPTHPEGHVLVPDATGFTAQIIDVSDVATWVLHCLNAGVTGTFNATGDAFPLADHLAAARAAAHSEATTQPAAQEWLIERGVGQWAGPESFPLWVYDPAARGLNAISNAAAKAAGLTLRPLVDLYADALRYETNRPADTPRRAGLSDHKENELLTELLGTTSTKTNT